MKSDKPIRPLSEAEITVCKACYEAGQASALTEIRELEEALAFALDIANWDNINRKQTDKLVILYKKYGKMDSEGIGHGYE